MIPIHEDTKAQASGKVKDIERYVCFNPKDVLPCAKAKIQYKWNSHDIAEMNQKHGGCHTCIHMCGIHKLSDTVDTGAWMPSVTSCISCIIVLSMLIRCSSGKSSNAVAIAALDFAAASPCSILRISQLFCLHLRLVYTGSVHRLSTCVFWLCPGKVVLVQV